MSERNFSPIWRLISRKQVRFVRLNGDGPSPPFYCVHSIGGEVISLRFLSRLLGSKLSFYGIQASRAELTAEFASSIPRIATLYADELAAFQPTGPLVLGGWSSGAVIALEMAQQLRARGRDVALLVVLDGPLYNTGGDTPWWHPTYSWKLLCNIPRWVVEDLGNDGGVRGLPRRLCRRLRRAGQSIVAGVCNTMPVPLVEGPGTSGWSEEQIAFARTLYTSVRNYVPERYDGRVIVYSARTRPLFPLVDVSPGWKRIAPAAEFVCFPGTHATMLQPPRVNAVADHLRKRLERCIGEEQCLHPPNRLDGERNAVAATNHRHLPRRRGTAGQEAGASE